MRGLRNRGLDSSFTCMSVSEICGGEREIELGLGSSDVFEEGTSKESLSPSPLKGSPISIHQSITQLNPQPLPLAFPTLLFPDPKSKMPQPDMPTRTVWNELWEARKYPCPEPIPLSSPTLFSNSYHNRPHPIHDTQPNHNNQHYAPLPLPHRLLLHRLRCTLHLVGPPNTPKPHLQHLHDHQRQQQRRRRS